MTPPRPGLVDPASLHQQALVNSFDLADVPFAQGCDPDAWWAPEDLAQLAQSPSWSLLGPEDRRRFCRVIALSSCENFIFLEEYLLVPAVEAVLSSHRKRLSPDLLACLEDFVAEEIKHSAMFRRLLEAAAPAWYPPGADSGTWRPRIYRSSWFENEASRLLVRVPGLSLWWIWLAILFEERTIDVYRRYQAGANVDPLFTAVHRFHMLEETRHVAIDQHLLVELWEKAPLWVRRANVAVLNQVMKVFTRPRNSARAAVDDVIAANPSLAPHRPALLADIEALGTNLEFQRANYSRAVLPKTFSLMDRYPELAAVRASLPAYTPASA